MTKWLLSSALIGAALIQDGAAQGPSSRVIDAEVWSAVSAAVARDDMDALARLYHPAAVVVMPGGTNRISTQMKKWKDDALGTKAKGVKATVEFRLTRRQDDSASAFEAGMFKFTQTEPTGAAKSQFIPFECLLVKEGGRWLMMMERQLEPGTEAAWNALAK
jgi:uncharacterized protein (TIGR02246 family)